MWGDLTALLLLGLIAMAFARLCVEVNAIIGAVWHQGENGTREVPETLRPATKAALQCIYTPWSVGV